MKLIGTILYCFIVGQLFGTAQLTDIFIYNQDTLFVYTNPLEEYFNKKGERKIGKLELDYSCTALWRGYVATWKLERDSLFLVKIQTNYFSSRLTAFVGIRLEGGD